MEEGLKHIDELFQQHLQNAIVEPPTGIFEQCIQHLNTGSVGNANPLSQTVLSQGKQLALASIKVHIVSILGVGIVAVTIGLSAYFLSKKQSGIPSNGSSQTAIVKPASVSPKEGLSAYSKPVNGRNQQILERQILKAEQVDIDRQAPNASSSSRYNNTPKKLNAKPHSGHVQAQNTYEKNANVSGHISSKIITKTEFAGNPPTGLSSHGKLPVLQGGETPTAGSNASMVHVGLQNSICNAVWKPKVIDFPENAFEIAIEGQVNSVCIDWGDGVKSNQIYWHQYLVEHNRKFNVKVVNTYVLSSNGHIKTCKDSQYLLISAQPQNEFVGNFIPDVFTPNGDGLNEEFWVNMAQPAFFDLSIYDTQNRTVFRTSDFFAKWAGNCGSNPCFPGTYRVVIAYKYSGDTEWKYHRKPLILLYKNN